MADVAIVTDSNSGITQEKAKKLGIRVLPMPFYIDGELFYEDITLTQEEFYQRLAEDADISTSQPSPAEVTGLWDEVLQDNDKIIYIPIFYMCKIIQQRFKRISKQISASSCQRTKSFSVKRIPCRNKLFPFCSQSRNLQASLNSFCTAVNEKTVLQSTGSN